jgi:hypothetical protein
MSTSPPASGAAKFNFNSFQEIKSHSSILYNERMAILFYLLDMKNLNMHKSKSIESIYDVYSVIKQIYKNIRMLLRFNPTVRATLRIETKDPGIYTIDVAISLIEKMINFCEANGFTEKKLAIIITELDNVEMMMKDILQYFSYFIRPDFKQKPDVEMATERYKQIVDSRTLEELKEIVGKSHQIDFESLGSDRIELLNTEIEYDPAVDGDLDEYMDEDDNIDIDEDEDEL